MNKRENHALPQRTIFIKSPAVCGKYNLRHPCLACGECTKDSRFRAIQMNDVRSYLLYKFHERIECSGIAFHFNIASERRNVNATYTCFFKFSHKRAWLAIRNRYVIPTLCSCNRQVIDISLCTAPIGLSYGVQNLLRGGRNVHGV